jgi:hypothetical protein
MLDKGSLWQLARNLIGPAAWDRVSGVGWPAFVEAGGKEGGHLITPSRRVTERN